MDGALGAVPSCSLEIRPFTVFVGPQGAGKSLIAQSLYLFEELPFLLRRALSERNAETRSDEYLFRWILDSLRSSDRSFATFANPKVKVAWETTNGSEWPLPPPASFEFRAYRNNRKITLSGRSRTFLAQLRKAVADRREEVLHHAIFFPTERMVISQLRSAMSEKLLSLPITYELFTHWLDDHAVVEAARWRAGTPTAPDPKVIDELGRSALGGSARKYGDQWKWQFAAGTQNQFDLDMASSGQRANWSLPFIARTLLTTRGTRDVAEQLTLFVEEPEIHLHPEAQHDVVKLLVFMVNRGFRVVITTHSMTVLYALNNSIQASLLPAVQDSGVPAVDYRLNPKDVSVYAFDQGAAPRQLVSRERAFIDEQPLGAVNDELSSELNRIAVRLPESATK